MNKIIFIVLSLTIPIACETSRESPRTDVFFNDGATYHLDLTNPDDQKKLVFRVKNVEGKT